MNVVAEIPPRTGMIQLAQKPFAGMSEGGMSDIVSQCDRLDQIAVEMQRRADRAGDTRNVLHVLPAPRDIVVAVKGKHLRFIGITVIVRAVHDFIDIAHEGGTPNCRPVVRIVVSPHRRAIRKRKRAKRSLRPFAFHARLQFIG